jgi:hypothetical protein
MVSETTPMVLAEGHKHTMALDQSALLEVLEALKAAEVDDRVRQAAQTIYQALIEAELSSVIGALPHQRTDTRVDHRVVSQAVVVATGVAADRHREVLGFDVVTARTARSGPRSSARSRLAACPGCSWSSPTRTPGSKPPSPACCSVRPGSAAGCTEAVNPIPRQQRCSANTTEGGTRARARSPAHWPCRSPPAGAGRTRRRRPHPSPHVPRPLPAAGHRARLAARPLPAMAGSRPHRPAAPAGGQGRRQPCRRSRAGLSADTKRLPERRTRSRPLPAPIWTTWPARPGPEAVDLCADRSADGHSRPAGLRAPGGPGPSRRRRAGRKGATRAGRPARAAGPGRAGRTGPGPGLR